MAGIECCPFRKRGNSNGVSYEPCYKDYCPFYYIKEGKGCCKRAEIVIKASEKKGDIEDLIKFARAINERYGQERGEKE